jgi:putative copper export protein
VLSPSLDTVRVFVHVLAATIWVGGQLTLAALVPRLRAGAPDAVRITARRFNTVAWPAFGVLVASGIWNLFEVDIAGTGTDYQVTLFVKLMLVAASGGGAAVHAIGRSKAAIVLGGIAAGLGGIGALFFGVLLVRGS